MGGQPTIDEQIESTIRNVNDVRHVEYVHVITAADCGELLSIQGDKLPVLCVLLGLGDQRALLRAVVEAGIVGDLACLGMVVLGDGKKVKASVASMRIRHRGRTRSVTQARMTMKITEEHVVLCGGNRRNRQK